MVDNLRTRVGESSDLRDLARAMETPFRIDAYDLGVAGAIAYIPSSVNIYINSWIDDGNSSVQKFALTSSSIPEVMALRLVQHSLPKSAKESKGLIGGLATTLIDLGKSIDELYEEQDKIYWLKNANSAQRLIVDGGKKVIQGLYKPMREFQYSEDPFLYKPSWVKSEDWAESKEARSGILLFGTICHNFKTAWMNMQGRWRI